MNECYWPEEMPPPPTATETAEGVIISGFPDAIMSPDLWATMDDVNANYLKRWSSEDGNEYLMLQGLNGRRIYRMSGREFGTNLVRWEAAD